MNVALARNEYKNAKSNALNSKSENFEAVSIALRHLLEAMTALKDVESPEDREPLFEKSLTSIYFCLLYTSPSPRDLSTSRMPSSA